MLDFSQLGPVDPLPSREESASVALVVPMGERKPLCRPYGQNNISRRSREVKGKRRIQRHLFISYYLLSLFLLSFTDDSPPRRFQSVVLQQRKPPKETVMTGLLGLDITNQREAEISRQKHAYKRAKSIKPNPCYLD
ncbi:hypothetical protein BDV36DRAFT_129154 [Aspergillus pseudocaelatus]|uniref:Uncharacterized protein n=1 Tax=Aspergillus pseudocaelatus TaxID=1825620 RepID=A0ABQ6VZH8_9EURO|nr:hypothetical protein BDV36DRAFT_129154 [Aspergillus pseudocaelatus]